MEKITKKTVDTEDNVDLMAVANKEQMRVLGKEVALNTKIQSLEMKCHAECEQIYKMRSQIIAGSLEDIPFQMNLATQSSLENKLTDGIPDFWLTVLKANPKTHNMIFGIDLPVLRSLMDIKLVYPNTRCYCIEFHFAKNPFLANEVLTKTYFWTGAFLPQIINGGAGFKVYKCVGCTINWLNNAVTPIESFFTYFMQNYELSSVTEDVWDFERRMMCTDDFQTGEFFRLMIIPRAIFFYTGEMDIE